MLESIAHTVDPSLQIISSFVESIIYFLFVYILWMLECQYVLDEFDVSLYCRLAWEKCTGVYVCVKFFLQERDL